MIPHYAEKIPVMKFERKILQVKPEQLACFMITSGNDGTFIIRLLEAFYAPGKTCILLGVYNNHIFDARRMGQNAVFCHAVTLDLGFMF